MRPSDPLISISFEGRGKYLRLSTPQKWERAIRSGDLTPDAEVEVDRGGSVEAMSAKEVPELAAFFPELPLAILVDPQPRPVQPKREPKPSPEAKPPAPVVEPQPESKVDYVDPPLEETVSKTAASPSQAKVPARSSGLGRGLFGFAIALAAVILLVTFATHTPAPTPTNPPTASSVAAPESEAAAPPAPPNPEPINTLVSWRADTDGEPKSYTVDGMTIKLSSRVGADGLVAPVIDWQPAAGGSFEELGVSAQGPAAAKFGVGKLDPTTDTNQILFTSFSGGAHCCTMVEVFELIGGAWKKLDIGSFEGELDRFPKDIDGGGAADIVETDDRFAFAFASFAESRLPPRIFQIVRGTVIDASQDTRFAKLYRADMRATEASCLAHSNGGCAAFVADATRIGLHDWAWQVMLTNYNQSSDWVLPVKCSVALVNNACPSGQEQKFSTFPEALDWFLSDAGYNTPAASQAQAVPSQLGPSFDCARAQDDNLKLVCNAPELAAFDRSLAAAYNDALARSSDRVTLQREERAWIARRRAAPANVDVLKQLYTERIAQLQASSAQ